MDFNKRFAGFTLAEVLVTLGIIGVVSAMTLPTLVKNHQRQVYVTQLRKVVNELVQAAEMCITDSNAVSLNESNIRRGGVETFLKTYFKINKYCYDDDASCLASSYTAIDSGSDIGMLNIMTDYNCAIIASGATVCLKNLLNTNNYMAVVVDTNASQGPNISCRDLFEFRINNQANIVPVGSAGIMINSLSSNEPIDCFEQLIENGWQMDY